jgi:peptide/nickel transport system substrate-binding protein
MRCVALAAAFTSALMCGGCRVQPPNQGHAREQVLYQSMTSDPRTFNPILATDAASGQALDDLFEGLVRINPMTTMPEKGLAQTWDITDGGKTITFHLRPDLKWSDGVPLTSRDVVFTMQVIYDKRIPTSLRPILLIDGKPIEVEAPDDRTVVMKLPRPFAPLLYAIGFGILPAHVLEPAYAGGKFNQTWNINTPPADIVGNGPYKMTRFVPAQLVDFARNPNFWMKDENGGQLPRLHGQSLLIVQDPNAEYLKFLSGQTDVYSPRPEEVLDLQLKQQRLKIQLPEIGIDSGDLFFCFNRNPRHYVSGGHTDPRLEWFTDLNFLRAIAHAVDKQGMINLCYHGLAVPAVAQISPANKIFHNPNLKDYDYDVKESADILEAAGYHLVRPGLRVDRHGNPLVFNLTTNTAQPVRDQMCAIFKQDLATLGIQVNYRPLEFTTLVEKLDSNFDWDCVLIGFTGTIEPNNGANVLRSSGNLHLWNPGEKTPATPWEAEIDRLLEEGTAEMDPNKRAPYYWKIQQILHDQLPMIETVRRRSFVAYKDSLEDFHPTVWGTYRPEYIQFREN